MDYFKVTSRFWRLHAQARLTPHETTLYLFLLQECNRLRWKNPFGYTNKALCDKIGISEKTLITARARLQQHSLITFKLGRKNCPTSYQLLALSDDLISLGNTPSISQSIQPLIRKSGPNSLENVGPSLHATIPDTIARPYERAVTGFLGSPVGQQVGQASSTATVKPTEYSADQSPLVDTVAFTSILQASNYGHVDIETYRQQMLATARVKKVSRSLPAWHKWITTYLNNERQRGPLLLPQTILPTAPAPSSLRTKASTASYIL